MPRKRFILLVLAALLFVACSPKISEKTEPAGASAGLHEALRVKNPSYNGQGQIEPRPGGIGAVFRQCGITDLSPLRDLPLKELDLQNNPVTDLTPLRGLKVEALYLEGTGVSDLDPLSGMPLNTLYLNGTKVRDLSPLRGLPLHELNLFGTQVADLGPLRGAPLEILWLNHTPVSDLGPLEDSSLVSLTIESTRVERLDVVRKLRRLERLHIAGTAISDLTPIEGLQLVRLIFSPGQIRKGISVARRMGSLREIGTSLEHRLEPAAFWEMYDKKQLR